MTFTFSPDSNISGYNPIDVTFGEHTNNGVREVDVNPNMNQIIFGVDTGSGQDDLECVIVPDLNGD